ncbi:unnamed protein product [Parnassius mnemosyne]|uniref:Uncharacterized protein n=1 Tax=Parnassius mnemosyne TaxID=213953 RepID=A0AAV1KAI5_9NEOP
MFEKLNKEITTVIYVIPLQISTLIVTIEAVTVNPSLCPTNKIAPHRRAVAGKYGTGRTFGAFYDLLAPDGLQAGGSSNLQEQPQADDPDDCGEIDDYDENDVGSATQSGRRQGNLDNRFFLGNFFNFLRPTTGYGFSTSQRPISVYPGRPTSRPTQSPYWSGGLFGSNAYRPPLHLNPSDYVKPVHEDGQEIYMTYRPGVVGGPLGHVVGVTQVTPTNRPPETSSQLNSKYINSIHFSMLSTKAPTNSHRRPRHRKINDANNGIFGSFIDLFLK